MKRLRRRLGLTQAGLAEAAGVHEQYVSQIERRQKSPTMETIDRLADALGVTPAELFGVGEDVTSSPSSEQSKRVEALLSAWSGADQEKLTAILVELRRIAGPPKRPPRSRKKRRG